ncbi:MAG: nucleoside hydrolase [Oceanipulchritudo sp.]
MKSSLKWIIDADTANEVDDLFAIVRAVKEPAFDIRAINSVHWQTSHYATPDTLEDSQRMNGALMSLLGRPTMPLPRGAHKRLYDWGQTQAHYCHAALNLIEEARGAREDERIQVMALGALTNIASALLIDPAIARKIDLYFLGTSYDFDTGILGKRDFNCVGDIHAVNVVLDCPELPVTLLPINVAAAFTFTYAEVVERLEPSIPVNQYLIHRWYTHLDGGRLQRVLWDLALVELLIHPDRGTLVEVPAPAEHGHRSLKVFRELDVEFLKEDFFRACS